MQTVGDGTVTVNIYIETGNKGPVRRRMAGAWLVEYISKTGKPVTRGGILYADITTENELALRLLIRAFSILTKPCCIRVFTECAHILHTMQNHWIWQWQKNGWINAKRKSVGNVDLWQQCSALLEQHITEWTDGEHSYRQCMLGRIQKEMGRDHALTAPENYLVVDVSEWNTQCRKRCQDEKRDRRKV